MSARSDLTLLLACKCLKKVQQVNYDIFVVSLFYRVSIIVSCLQCVFAKPN